MYLDKLGAALSAAVPLLSLAGKAMPATPLILCREHVINILILDFAEVSFVKYGLPEEAALCCNSWSELWLSLRLSLWFSLPGTRSKSNLQHVRSSL